MVIRVLKESAINLSTLAIILTHTSTSTISTTIFTPTTIVAEGIIYQTTNDSPVEVASINKPAIHDDIIH